MLHKLIAAQIAQYHLDIMACIGLIADAYRDGKPTAPHSLRIMHADVAIHALERLQDALVVSEREVQS